MTRLDLIDPNSGSPDAPTIAANNDTLRRWGNGGIGTDNIAAGAIVDADVNAAAGIVYTKLNLATSIKASDMATVLADAPYGKELDYFAKTSNTPITATSEATANTIVTGNSVSFDGATAVLIEFYSPFVQTSGAANQGVVVVLYDAAGGGSAASVGLLGEVANGATATAIGAPAVARCRLTPSNAAHVYSIRAYNLVAGTSNVQGGAGGGGAFMPAFIRISKA